MKSSNILVIAQFFLLISYIKPSTVPEETQIQDTDVEAKGILDVVTGGTTTPSSSAPGLGGLAGLGQNVGGAGPMLIIGGFQAIVTKFDPSLIQGLPGLSGVAGGLPTGK